MREATERSSSTTAAITPVSNCNGSVRANADHEFETRLDVLLGSSRGCTSLQAAARYATLAPGQQTRPKLVLAIAGHNPVEMGAACSIEMIRAASLILDDLPYMDNARLRRSQTATHLVFGQQIAILAGVALITRAVSVLAAIPIEPAQTTKLVEELSKAFGVEGMAEGQALDLEQRADSFVSAEVVNAMKTGALFVVAVNMSAEVAKLGRCEKDHLADFAAHLGLAFQLYDDIKDVTFTEEDAGKPVGANLGKPNFVQQVGLQVSWSQLLNRMLLAEKSFKSAGFETSHLRAIFAPVYEKLKS